MDRRDANSNVSKENGNLYKIEVSDQIKSNNQENVIGDILSKLGMLGIVVSFIVGFSLGYDKYDDFNWMIASLYWITGFVSGMILIGFGEVIKLLQRIADATNQK